MLLTTHIIAYTISDSPGVEQLNHPHLFGSDLFCQLLVVSELFKSLQVY